MSSRTSQPKQQNVSFINNYCSSRWSVLHCCMAAHAAGPCTRCNAIRSGSSTCCIYRCCAAVETCSCYAECSGLAKELAKTGLTDMIPDGAEKMAGAVKNMLPLPAFVKKML